MAAKFYGTNGDNTIYQSNHGPDFAVFAKGGNDAIYLNLVGYLGGNNYVDAGYGNDIVNNSFEGDSDIILGDGNDTYIGNGFSTIGNFFDIVSGGAGDDLFTIRTSHSEYYGDGGNDSFQSIGLNNYFNGGAGNDLISYQLQDFDPALAGIGVHVDLDEQFASTGGARSETLINFESVEGTSFADTLLGADANNRLWGLGGRDIIDARMGDDQLFGGYGNDDLYGGGGRDILDGGQGSDLLTGNAQSDVFDFNKVSDSEVGIKRDVVADFQDGDMLDLSGIDAKSATAGNNAFSFINGAAFSGA